jgi:uncharacterized protein YegL
MVNRPGGELSTRPIHFIWIADCSSSMAGEKIASLNTAIREAIPHMQKVASENPNAEVLVRAVKFSSGAQWHISQPTKIEQFQWSNLDASGSTSMGHALRLVADQLKIPPMTDRALPPVLVLITDGQPTDDFKSGLQALINEPWGKKAVRIGIAIGSDADEKVLQDFMGNPELKPLRANNSDTLVNYIKWVSTAVLKAASAPPSQANQSPNATNVPIPQPPSAGQINPNDVW